MTFQGSRASYFKVNYTDTHNLEQCEARGSLLRRAEAEPQQEEEAVLALVFERPMSSFP